jgi:phospholipase/lecithinase/hemolysin
MKCWENHAMPVADPSEQSAQICLSPVYDDGSENKTWSKSTPSGEVRLLITNPDAIDAFEVGETYFVDFTPAD